jgi:hemerythrin-like domain-containing protein
MVIMRSVKEIEFMQKKQEEAMMVDQPKPNVAASLFVLHKVLTRALAVSIENTQTFSEGGFPDEGTRDGFLNYLRAFMSILHGHHLVEDELAFPYFRDKLAEAPFDMLSGQHAEMLEIVEAINAAVGMLAGGSGMDGLAQLTPALKQLEALWHPHIAVEEEHLTMAKMDDLLPVEEQLRLIKEYSTFSQEHTGPPYLTLPFILFNLPPDAREVMSRAMPEELTQKMVPIVWKPQWESMSPFLLV